MFAACAGAVLGSDVGRQALVDERVRSIESFGGSIDDAEYAALLARPPWWVYFTSGGRVLLTPGATLIVALVCWAIARADGAAASYSQALSLVVHATVVLAVGQIIATPLAYIRESLTTPLNLASVLPAVDEGTMPARVFGAIDLFTLWWLALVALGLSALTGRRVRRYAVSLSAVYAGLAVIMAGVMAAIGGT